MRPTKSRSWFTRFAKATSRLAGRPSAFFVASGIVLVWIVTGPLFQFSDSWQLVINTGTTIVTFLMAIALHVVSGASDYNQEQAEHGLPPVSPLQYAGTSRFWFESFQNWQSEFLAIALVVLLSIFLRQRGSPESKPVDSPHGETGAG